MRIHYNNGEKEFMIEDVLSIMIIDGNSPAIVCLNDGREFNVSLDNIEMILDEKIFEKGGGK